jgi:hypothetical protein
MSAKSARKRRSGDRVEILPPGMLIFTKAVLLGGVGGGILGATIGAALRTINGAGMAA